MALPPWITTIFSHSIGEFADGLWTRATAEDKAANFGSGWGDEHQLQEILAKLGSKRPKWMSFIRWNFVDRNGFFTRQIAKSRQKKLRLFLTSWDKTTERGTKTTNVEKKIDDKTTEKVQLVEKVFKSPTKNALEFVKRCVEIIEETEAQALKACEALVPEKIKKGLLPSNYVLTDDVKRKCLEAGYVELVRYFEAAQLPIMPVPGSDHFTKSVDDWIIGVFGAEVKPIQILQAAVIVAGASLLNEMERDQARLAAARASKWWVVKVPITHLINLFA
jgi:hypothetical protein